MAERVDLTAATASLRRGLHAAIASLMSLGMSSATPDLPEQAEAPTPWPLPAAPPMPTWVSAG